MGGQYFNVNSVQRQQQSPAQYYQSSYANQALVGGDDAAMGMGPVGGNYAMSCSDDLMASPFQMGGMSGMMGGMNGMRQMGYGPGSETMNMTQEQYMQYQEKLENYQIDKQVRQKGKYKMAGFEANSSEDVISRRIAILQGEIKNNNQQNVFNEYTNLTTAIRDTLAANNISKDVSDEKIKAYAEKLYFNKTGKNIGNELEDNGDSKFVYGLKKGFCGIGWLFMDNKSYEDNLSNINGTPVTTASKAMEYLGMGISGLLTGAAVLFLGKGIKALFK